MPPQPPEQEAREDAEKTGTSAARDRLLRAMEGTLGIDPIGESAGGGWAPKDALKAERMLTLWLIPLEGIQVTARLVKEAPGGRGRVVPLEAIDWGYARKVVGLKIITLVEETGKVLLRQARDAASVQHK